MKLVVYTGAKQKNAGDQLNSTQKLNFCKYESLTKFKEIVSERISRLISLRPGCYKIYKYQILVRIYMMSKNQFWELEKAVS